MSQSLLERFQAAKASLEATRAGIKKQQQKAEGITTSAVGPIIVSRRFQRPNFDFAKTKAEKAKAKKAFQEKRRHMTDQQIDDLCWKKFKTPAWAVSPMKIAMLKGGII